MDLWHNLSTIAHQLRTHHGPLLLLLDFDGTLAPIVPTPEKAALSLATKHVLQQLVRKNGLYVTILSGRQLPFLQKKVPIPGVLYVGNHGLEEEIFGKKISFALSKEQKTHFMQVKKDLKSIAAYPGVLYED